MTPLAASNLRQFVQEAKQAEKIHGDIISWDLAEGTSISYSELQGALSAADLEVAVARELLPRYAFTRAIKEMQEQRIIKRVAEANGKIAFQFTMEQLQKSGAQVHFEYQMETILILDKVTGAITSDDTDVDDLIDIAKDLLAKATEARTTADVSRVIKRLFEKNADMFPLRKAGGIYFVPAQHLPFADKIEHFVSQLHGELHRMPVPVGTKRGDRSVKAAVESGIKDMLAELRTAKDQITVDTREATVAKAIERVELVQFKISVYAQYLEDAPARLRAEAETLKQEYKQKVTELLSAKV